MPIPIFVIVIEKTTDFYTAYTPNISGLSATAESREEVERVIIQKMAKYIDDLGAQHTDSQRRLQLTTAPIEEKISCRYKYSDSSWRSTCQAASQKEGLCFQHWKLLYGHEVNSKQRFRKCQLCGEEEPLKLADWNDRCSYKAEHDDWATTLASKRNKEALELKENKAAAKRLQKAQELRRQCRAIKTQGRRGLRCSNEAVTDGLCTTHWQMANS